VPGTPGTGTLTTNLPTPATFGMPIVWCSNNTDASIDTVEWMGFDMMIPCT
jgi:hypothetical protein